MNKIQSNQYAMMMAVSNVFAKYNETLQSIPALQTTATEFSTRLTEIDKVLMIQEGRITGTAQQKQKEEREMIDATIRVSAGMYVFALDHANFELAQKVDLSPSDLIRMPQKQLQTTCENVLQLANELGSELDVYGITANDTTNLTKEIGDYAQVMAAPRSEIVTRSEATTRLMQLMNDQINLLNQKTDRLMVMFKNTNAVFYNEYKSARIIVNMGVRHASAEKAEME